MLIVLSPSCSMDMSHFHIPCELNSSMAMYVGEGREGSQGGALSMWTHASVHVDCVCFLIMNRSTHHVVW